MNEQWTQPGNDGENKGSRKAESKEEYRKVTTRKNERAVETKLSGGRAERRKSGIEWVLNGRNRSRKEGKREE